MLIKSISNLDGFSGPTCEEISPCNSNPCKNNGTCILPINDFLGTSKVSEGYSCICPSLQYTGYNCEFCKHLFIKRIKEVLFQFFNKVNPCFGDPCKNGATCYSDLLNNQPICACQNGYYGKLCEKTISCADVPCKNGVCIDQPTASSPYTCNCLNGYFGVNCTIQVTTEKCAAAEPPVCKMINSVPKCNVDETVSDNPIGSICPKTCGLCDVEQQCRDVMSQEYCSYLKLMNVCSSLKDYCAKTCDSC